MKKYLISELILGRHVWEVDSSRIYDFDEKNMISMIFWVVLHNQFWMLLQRGPDIQIVARMRTHTYKFLKYPPKHFATEQSLAVNLRGHREKKSGLPLQINVCYYNENCTVQCYTHIINTVPIFISLPRLFFGGRVYILISIEVAIAGTTWKCQEFRAL